MIKRAYCRSIVASDFIVFLSPTYISLGPAVFQLCMCATGMEKMGQFIHTTDLSEMIFGEIEDEPLELAT